MKDSSYQERMELTRRKEDTKKNLERGKPPGKAKLARGERRGT